MRVDISELIRILRLPTLKLYQELKKCPYAIAGQHYVLWYRDEGLPCLVAHIDHVYDEAKGWAKRPILCNGEYLWSPRGIAGDDRCGVYSLMLLFHKLEVNALFTDIEERGGIGATEACEEKRLEKTPYFIEVDRKGVREAVFYNGEEEVSEFVNIISKHFKVEHGSFSDISILGDHFQVCSVNLSAGYYNPHQESAEYIYVPSLQYTIETIPKLIEELGDKRYKLPELPLWSYYSYSYWSRSRSRSRRINKIERSSYLWRYDDYIPEVEEEISRESDCPMDCYDCGALDWDRIVGYWCWELDDNPNPDSPKCLKKRMREVEKWL